MPQKPLQYYTLAQAADYLGIHKNFLRVKMQNGEIKFDCLDGCNRPMFTRATLNQYIAQNQRRPIDKTDYIRDSTLRELLESLGPVSGLNLQASSTLAMARLGLLPPYQLSAYGSYRCYHKKAVLRLLDFLREQRVQCVKENQTSTTGPLHDTIWTQYEEDAWAELKKQIQDRW